MTSVLVTGGDGQVGRSVLDIADDHRFRHLSLAVLGRRDCDITDQKSVAAAIEALDPAVIINAAGYTAVDAAESDPEAAMRVNRDGVAHLAAYDDRRLIQLSTDYVFDGTKSSWYTESDPVAPLGVYGETKWLGEQAASTNPRHLTLRTSWVYAAHGTNFVKAMLQLGAHRRHVQVVDDQTGCPTSAHDIAVALLQLVDYDLTGVFHLAGSEDATWCEFATAIFDTAQLDVVVEPTTTANYSTPAPRPENSRLDSSTLAAATGIRLPGWRSSLPRVVDALQHSAHTRTRS